MPSLCGSREDFCWLNSRPALWIEPAFKNKHTWNLKKCKKPCWTEKLPNLRLWCFSRSIHWCVSTPSLSYWLIDWCRVLRKLRFVKTEMIMFAVACLSSCPCLVWDFFRPFSGSGHYNGHIMPLWVRQNTCQEWSRLITVPVKVGGPVVTQRSTPISSFITCFWRRKLLKGPLQPPTQVFQL